MRQMREVLSKEWKGRSELGRVELYLVAPSHEKFQQFRWVVALLRDERRAELSHDVARLNVTPFPGEKVVSPLDDGQFVSLDINLDEINLSPRQDFLVEGREGDCVLLENSCLPVLAFPRAAPQSSVADVVASSLDVALALIRIRERCPVQCELGVYTGV